jgi:diguanylate cyclase (GGDEF)-like protein/PAS domain S-box-containing protein
MRRVSVASGIAVITIGAVVLLGWIVGSDTLTRVASGLVAMKANTAIGMIAAGAALVLLRAGAPPRFRDLGRGLGLLVALLGAVVIGEYLFGGIGIDKLLSAGDTDPNPGRPSPHTAVVFLVYGIAIATIDRRGRARLLNSVAIVLFACVVLFALVGYAYGVDYLHSLSGTVGVAPTTLVSMAVLCVGLLSLRPREGPLAFLYGDDAGARMARLLLPVAVGAPILFGLVRYIAQSSELVGLEVGIAVYTLVSIVGLAALVVFTARRLRGVDAGMRQLASIVASADDAILSIDRERLITSWNAGAKRMFGYAAEEAIGRPVTDLVPDDRLEEFAQRMERVDAGASINRWETERQHKDGSRIEVSLTVAPLRGIGGEVVGAAAIVRDIGESREAARRFQSLLQAAPDGIVIVDEEGRIALVNEKVEEIFGYPRGELVGFSVDVLVPEYARAGHADRRGGYVSRPASREMATGLELEGRRRDGSHFPAEISLSPLESSEGLLVIAAVRDVSRRRQTEIALAESEERFRRSFEDSGVGMALVRVEEEGVGRVFESNAAFQRITGYEASELARISPAELIEPSELDLVVEDVEALLGGLRAVARREVRFVSAAGEEVWASVTASAVRGADGEPAYLVVQAQDISERKGFERQLQYLADHDALTGLFNRRRFEEELAHEVAVAERFGGGGAVLVLDLDHFKLVNDSLGHAAGDELIATVAELLRDRLRASDVLGRMGGDEFAVVLPRVDVNGATRTAEDLLAAVRAITPSVGDGRGRVTASVGISFLGAREGAADPQGLLADADIAMYDAKEAGRDRVVVFDPLSPRHARVLERLGWVERIEAALASDRFVLHAQPIVPLVADGCRRYELLLRMVGSDGELILPGEFLGTAERSDLVQRIDRWVIAEAIELLARQERLGNDVCFEINLSGRSIGAEEGLADHISACLARTGANPARIVFEVTETAAIVNVTTAKEFARQMHDLGCGFALDDFGAGFASFYYLKHLSFDLLKIDGEFIRNLPSSPTDQLVVRSVVDIATGLGKSTVAESVGDQATVDLLRAYGVDYAQGFFLGKPGPLEVIEGGASDSALVR